MKISTEIEDDSLYVKETDEVNEATHDGWRLYVYLITENEFERATLLGLTDYKLADNINATDLFQNSVWMERYEITVGHVLDQEYSVWVNSITKAEAIRGLVMEGFKRLKGVAAAERSGLRNGRYRSE